MKHLQELVTSHEDWLMRRVLQYAKDYQYVKYTSTLLEAWRTSIVGLSEALVQSVKLYDGPPGFGPDEDFFKDPVASFGILEAQRHRARGITLGMFLGLMKYYRQSYIDLVILKESDHSRIENERLYLERFFDRIELGFVTEWVQQSSEDITDELQTANRIMTNEKNRYLTIFESLGNPVILLNENNKIENMNHASLELFTDSKASGAYYYGHENKTEPLSWLSDELSQFEAQNIQQLSFDKKLSTESAIQHFEVKLKRMMDISGKFSGTIVILNNITERRQAEQEKTELISELQCSMAEIKKLSGFIPICSSCKKIRDDKGYWQQVEQYVSERSEAQFSHGICPDCMKKLYPEFADEVLKDPRQTVKSL